MKSQSEYIESGGGECPYCSSGDLEGKSFDHYGSFVTQIVVAYDCGKSWKDYYTLTRYEALD